MLVAYPLLSVFCLQLDFHSGKMPVENKVVLTGAGNLLFYVAYVDCSNIVTNLKYPHS